MWYIWGEPPGMYCLSVYQFIIVYLYLRVFYFEWCITVYLNMEFSLWLGTRFNQKPGLAETPASCEDADVAQLARSFVSAAQAMFDMTESKINPWGKDELLSC